MASSNIPYAPHVDKFECTDEFRYLALFFERNDEHYTYIPKGTVQHKEFWLEEVKNKCMYGMTNSKGITITGQHFFYLNFIQILGKDKLTGKKKKIFPRFLDVDYDYFHIVEHARKNQKGVILVKPRRLGFSYKAACLCSHEFTFFKDSKSLISAFLSKFSDNTMGMVLDNLNFLNTHTEFAQERNPDTRDFIRASYLKNVGGVKVSAGKKSEVRQITFKDNSFAAVGQSANWFIIDEAGVFPNIIESYNITEPIIKDGSDYSGVALVFGSAGSMEGGSQYFYEMFTNPGKYNMLEFPDPHGGNNIGWFVSAARGRLGTSKTTGKQMVDLDGNSDEIEAAVEIEREREDKRAGMDPKALHDLITQYPLDYKEAFLRSKGNIFPTIELQEWLGKVETTGIKDECKIGELYFDNDNKIKFRLNADLHPIIDFPVKAEAKKDGCIVLFEEPETVNGVTPPHLYIAGCDPYDQDKADSSVSLGSFFVYKRFYRADKTHDIIVAEYTGRPEFADTFYENCRRLCIYYNAKCLYENQLKGFKAYFETKHCLQYLYEQPQIIKDIVKDSRVSRGYGIHMNRGANGSNGIKDQCEMYLKQWLLEERADVDGTKILNLHTIKSIGLLKELIAYDKEGNYDRAIAIFLCILQTKELHKIHLENYAATYEKDKFFTKKFFTNKPNFQR